MTITREQLIAYLDDALGESDTAKVEQLLRESEPSRQELRQLLQDRDRGEHTLGAIWRRQRLTCLTRAQLGSYLLKVLEPGLHDYVQFHLQTIGCPFCRANLTDLEAQQNRAAPEATKRRRRYFESSANLLHKPS